MEETHEIQISAKQSVSEVLRIAQEKSLPVIVNLAGGGRYSGRVKDQSPGAVVIWRVAGKENFDIYIPTGPITSVELEVRVGK